MAFGEVANERFPKPDTAPAPAHTVPRPYRVVALAPHRVIDHFNLAAAVVAVCPGKELEGRRGLVPGAALVAAWVFGLGS